MTYDAPPARGNLGLGVAMGALVGAIVILIAWFALDSPDAATPAPSPSPSASATTSPSPTRTPTVTPTPSTTPSATATATDTPTVAPSEPASATPPAPPGIVTSLPAGWVTVLESLPKASTTPEQAVAKAAEWSQHGYTASVLDTDAFAGLNRGYYAIAITGQTGREDFRAVCAAYGQPPNKCYPREIKG